MKVLVAPDWFGVDLAAAEAADAVALGWLRSAPYDELDLLPLSDGGPGFVDVLGTALGGQVGVVTVRGPLGDPVPARVLHVGDTAYVEAAEAVGLHLVAPEARDAVASSSYGVGELLLAAAATGVHRVVVGVGGTATTDGGRGLVAAVAAGFVHGRMGTGRQSSCPLPRSSRIGGEREQAEDRRCARMRG